MRGIRDAGYRVMRERVLASMQAPRVTIDGHQQSVLNLSSNNYLGLATHPQVVAASREGLEKRGLGAASARFISGTLDIHVELERKIAEFHGHEAAILYASCFDANAGLFDALLTKDDVVLSDSLNHASIIDGIRMSKAQKLIYKHVDLSDLEAKLSSCQDAKLRVIATDGVFSMDGEVAPLRNICDLAQKYKALVFIDECHATGIIGKTGRGTVEYWNIPGSVHIVNSSIGKALGGASGGYTSGPKELIELLRQRSRPYIFSSTLSSSVVAGAIKAFDILLSGSPLVAKLADNAKYFRKQMADVGFKIIPGDHPLVPVLVGDAEKAEKLAEQLFEEGVLVTSMCFPVVPQGEARIRVVLSAQHTHEDLDVCVRKFTKAGGKVGVI
ncbi:2-amino-3-ketobutyrate coenzyme A ligase, mitochondrial-like [Corticium candelabrum]|uniref:2-amino-3-ketobutyrate coenzyme A ligase, mitochondrial-like n=1 Tax=Corticium candelabrum TaxID=121492 RepID=UPI002E274836|nr:2-amino-3-ketobutyrate coenzyme A ligase, mitochondrial-like [Corticium candelabrum]